MKISIAMIVALGVTAPQAWGNSGKAGTKAPIGMGSEATPATNTVAQKIREEIKRDTTLSSQAQSLKVSADKDSVIVSGTVATEAERDKVEAVARQYAGANKVTMDVVVQ